MYSVKKYWWLLVLFVAQDLKSQELVLVAGLAKPPYVIPEQDTGFEVDLVRGVLATLGHDISMLYVPYGRTYETMKQMKADIGLTLSIVRQFTIQSCGRHLIGGFLNSLRLPNIISCLQNMT